MELINWHTLLFLLYAAIACSFSVAVVMTSNVVRMAFFLIIALSGTAGLFFLAGADFIGAMQLVLYVGGTLVLLVFGVMLTAQSPFISIRTTGGEWVLAALVGGSLLAVLIPSVAVIGAKASEAPKQAHATEETSSTDARNTATPMGAALFAIRADKMDEPNKIKREGMSGYLLPFEIISIHLLVVLVGAAFLARAKRRKRTQLAEN